VHSITVDTVDGQVDSRYECAADNEDGCVGDDSSSTDWWITTFGFGPFGETTRTYFKPDKTAQTTHYDPLGRPDFQRNPSSGDTVTTYNAFGEVASITDAEHRVTTFEYDVLGRVVKKTSPDGIATNTWDTAPNGRGMLSEALSSDGITIGHTYNAVGKDSTTTWTIQGTPYEFGYDYDAVGRLNCITYPTIPGATSSVAAARLTIGRGQGRLPSGR
jgi:YD repeat-containing protein